MKYFLILFLMTSSAMSNCMEDEHNRVLESKFASLVCRFDALQEKILNEIVADMAELKVLKGIKSEQNCPMAIASDNKISHNDTSIARQDSMTVPLAKL